MQGEITIELPGKYSTNVLYRKHAMKRYPIEQDFYKAVLETVRRFRVEPVEGYPLQFEYFFSIPGKQLDNLNLSGMAKMVEDGLRHAKVIKEDTPAEVAGVYLHQRKALDKRCLVTVSWVPMESPSRNARK